MISFSHSCKRIVKGMEVDIYCNALSNVVIIALQNFIQIQLHVVSDESIHIITNSDNIDMQDICCKYHI